MFKDRNRLSRHQYNFRQPQVNFLAKNQHNLIKSHATVKEIALSSCEVQDAKYSLCVTIGVLIIILGTQIQRI